MFLILLLLLVFAGAFLFTGLWLALAQRHKWIDLPNYRSSHVRPTPKSGGAGFVAAYSLFVLSMYAGQQLAAEHLLLVATGLLLAIMGFIDDLRSLGIWQRIGLQTLAAVIALILLEPVPPVVFPWGAFEPEWLRGLLLVSGLVWLINLYNFMDGIDALAAMEAIFFCLALALFTGAGGAEAVTTMSLGLALAVSGFLYFNLPPARLFMGDLGSNYLGYILGVLGGLAIQSGSVNIWTLLVLLGVFIVDTAATLLGRMRAKLMWYHAHRSHAYQQAASRLDSHGRVVLFIGLLNVCWLLPLAWLTTVHESWGVIITVVAWIPLYLLGRIIRQPPQAPTATSQKSA